MKKFVEWIIIILPIIFVATLGSIFVNIGIDWFNSLTKPSQWIANFVIPVVWTIVYLAFATILVIWNSNAKISLSSKILLIINGVLNVLWCLVFFTLKQTFLGNIFIILNLIVGFWLFVDIYKQKKLYAYVLIIYPVWLSIATTLNLAIWILN